MKKIIAILVASLALTAFAADAKKDTKQKAQPAKIAEDVRTPAPNVSPEDKARNKMLLAKKKKDKKVKKDATKSHDKKSK